MSTIEYWLGLDKLIVSRKVTMFPAYLPGQPIALDGVAYYINDISWNVSTAKDPRVQGETHACRMIVRLESAY